MTRSRPSPAGIGVYVGIFVLLGLVLMAVLPQKWRGVAPVLAGAAVLVGYYTLRAAKRR